jgi:4-amino-4-deoxy-L-arabinose transferase-like glycosyltransferase
MSYVDHPPMAAWMIAAGRFIAGDNPFGIRLCAVLAPIIGFLALWRFAHILFGEVVAERAVWFALAMPLSRGGRHCHHTRHAIGLVLGSVVLGTGRAA